MLLGQKGSKMRQNRTKIIQYIENCLLRKELSDILVIKHTNYKPTITSQYNQ